MANHTNQMVVHNDHSYYDVKIVDGNLEPMLKYFKALINGFGGCGEYAFCFGKEEDIQKVYVVPSDMKDINSMVNNLKDFINQGVSQKTFDVRIVYFGNMSMREFQQIHDFTDELSNKYLKMANEKLIILAKYLTNEIQCFGFTQHMFTEPIILNPKLTSIQEMLSFLSILKTKFNIQIVKYLVLKKNAKMNEIRFYTVSVPPPNLYPQQQNTNQNVQKIMRMFVLFEDYLFCCNPTTNEKYLLDIDDGFLTVSNQKVVHGEYHKSFNKWKKSGYNKKLKIKMAKI
ncbi:MAG: hypothetical protein Satyrvirus6_16 [Satyrvirus sp.]|uniref:Uncharacterized protein n=1 Tax=Satyrvirus sp. TaxID=2487771 RepID=A0A3G5AF17_9VIRU|nr:MAG: hypothetical protein Satyrvirus6_16 [Satyrvirus sp.]